MKNNVDKYGFLTGSSIHSNKIEAYAVKNIEVMKLSQSVCVTLNVSYTRLGVFLQLTKHEFHTCSFLNASTLQQKKLES